MDASEPEPATAAEASLLLRPLDERARFVLTRRAEGSTLDDIGQRLGVTRERVRQLEGRAEAAIRELVPPALAQAIERRLAEHPVVSSGELEDLLPGEVADRTLVLRAMGLRLGSSWSGDVAGWWTDDPNKLMRALRALAAQAPFAADELPSRAASCGLPDELPTTGLLQAPGSPVVFQAPWGWARRMGQGRDLAFLWLNAAAEPRTAEEVANAVGLSSGRALGEAMRRDERFTQVRPEGTWALSDWKGTIPSRQYMSAEDVVLDVLREKGALSESALIAEARRRYPVSTWRYTQVLSSNRIGVNSDGLFDLAERGARPLEDKEPRRPDNMQASGDGQMIGVKLPVDRDVLRGSGINVNRWLSWKLGLRNAPTQRSFALTAFETELIVRRNTSTTSISSLRSIVVRMGLTEGCEIALVLRLADETADVRHVCEHCSVGGVHDQ